MYNNESLLTVHEVALYLRLNSLTVYDYIRAGNLKAIKFGRSYRVIYRDLIEFINNHKVI